MATPLADVSFTQSFDARDWARAFVEMVRKNPSIATDEGTMLGWFANALMRGYDEKEKRLRGGLQQLLAIVKNGDAPAIGGLPQVDLASTWYVRLASEVEAVCDRLHIELPE